MDTIARLPFHSRIIPGIHDEHLTCFRQIECYAAGFERDKEDCDFGVFGETFDCCGTGRGGHVAVQFDAVEPGTTDTPLNQVEETGELGEDN
jgi:hypothetical protein